MSFSRLNYDDWPYKQALKESVNQLIVELIFLLTLKKMFILTIVRLQS